MMDPQVAWDKVSCLLPNEIAAFLQDQGITGIKKSQEYCPLARWLKLATGEDTHIGSVALVNDGHKRYRSMRHTCSTRNFMRTFDAGGYPFLEAVDLS